MRLSLLGQLMLYGVVQGALYSLFAMGFGIIYRSFRFFDVSCAGTYILTPYLLFAFWNVLGFQLIPSLTLAILVTAIYAAGLERAVYSRLYRRSAGPQVLLIASIGIFVIVENVIAMIFGSEVKVFPQWLAANITSGQISFSKLNMLQFLIGLGISLSFYGLTKRNLSMKALWALGDEPDLIEILGISREKLRMLAAALGALLIGLASSLSALEIGMDPFTGMNALLTAAVIVIMGGKDSVVGWIVGSFVLAFVHSIVIYFLSPNWTPVVTFIVLILIMMIRPEGLFSARKRLEE